MTGDKILDKLRGKLTSVPTKAEDLVYILSLIRKVLESDNKPEHYSVLNFYCNLALHIKITKPPQIVVKKLRNIASGKSYSDSIVGFSDLQVSLKDFFDEYNLPNFYKTSTTDERKRLQSLFLEIYSDVPILLENTTRYKVVIERIGDQECTISYTEI